VHVDVAGIIRGNPQNRNTRIQGRDLVEPDLVDLTRLIAPQERYSFIFRRKKQQLDYMLVNRIEKRFSDHAGLLARFNW
jgi:phosphate uptake regulator